MSDTESIHSYDTNAWLADRAMIEDYERMVEVAPPESSSDESGDEIVEVVGFWHIHPDTKHGKSYNFNLE